MTMQFLHFVKSQSICWHSLCRVTDHASTYIYGTDRVDKKLMPLIAESKEEK